MSSTEAEGPVESFLEGLRFTLSWSEYESDSLDGGQVCHNGGALCKTAL